MTRDGSSDRTREAPFRALVVDDDSGVRYTLRAYLEDGGVETLEAPDGEAALSVLETNEVDLVLTDLRMPKLDGLGLLEKLKERERAGSPMPLLVMITAQGTERDAVAAIKLGAFDYFKKPFEPEALEGVIERARRMAGVRGENERLRGELQLARSMLFVSPKMGRLAQLVARVGPRDVTVLITGESGTGKERVAEAIVRGSSRASRPFVRFNCAAIPGELAEAELFGHKKGAFTGAHRDRTGLFREADGGTILLDEIGELDPRTQAKLLRVLQERAVRPVGEDRSIAVDVRVISATHRDLAELSKTGSFRVDLLYRLKVVHLEVPALRERPEDVPVLFRHFVERAAERFGVPNVRVDDATLARLSTYAWPGNVRELENLAESVVALSPDGRLDPALLPGRAETAVATAASAGLKERVEAYERGLIVAALVECRQNRTEAAKQLGIGRATLHEKLAKYGLKE